MTRFLGDDPVTQGDFQALFADEPATSDPADDLRRGRRLRRRRRITGGVVALVVVVGLAGTLGAVGHDRTQTVGLASRPSAVPSPSEVSRGPGPSSTPSAAPTSGPADGSRDTAPVLRRNADGDYVDSDDHQLGRPTLHRAPSASPFHDTTRNSWKLAVRYLDPSRDHLDDYDSFAFTGGGGGGGGVQIGQKLGWTVRGDRGEGMVQLAVTRLEPGSNPRLGSGRSDADGFCNDDYLPRGACRRTTVAGVEVYLAKTSDGGFVMDRQQLDGEVASVIVSPLFANNTEKALGSMGISPAAAAALLDDPALDVVG